MMQGCVLRLAAVIPRGLQSAHTTVQGRTAPHAVSLCSEGWRRVHSAAVGVVWQGASLCRNVLPFLLNC